eukprot:COSAG02_NODE_34708_length_479_cov_35.815789_1_plen_89_part_00
MLKDRRHLVDFESATLLWRIRDNNERARLPILSARPHNTLTIFLVLALAQLVHILRSDPCVDLRQRAETNRFGLIHHLGCGGWVEIWR